MTRKYNLNRQKKIENGECIFLYLLVDSLSYSRRLKRYALGLFLNKYIHSIEVLSLADLYGVDYLSHICKIEVKTV